MKLQSSLFIVINMSDNVNSE